MFIPVLVTPIVFWNAFSTIVLTPITCGIIFLIHLVNFIFLFQARVRILALVAKLFSLSYSVASVIYNSDLLTLFEVEISKTNDMLTTLSALELLYEVITYIFTWDNCDISLVEGKSLIYRLYASIYVILFVIHVVDMVGSI